MYKSTRNLTEFCDSKEAILRGISFDGGLYIDDDIRGKRIDVNSLLNLSYMDIAYEVISRLLPEYTEDELKDSIKKAYSKFDSEDVAPLKKVGDIYVLELFHGPTSAFKDVALTLLPYLMSIALKRVNKKALILTATSGDTGKAALSGFSDVDNIDICVFYPHMKVSKIQYMQMATQRGSNVRVYGVIGNFDDTQSAVKKAFLDEDLKRLASDKGIFLTSANSINIGRLIPQVVYYFSSYIALVKEGEINMGDKISYSVPTGNFGDILAGYYAYLMGLPIKYLYIATNDNRVLTDFIETGIYDIHREFKKTISPSMDILISSNFERLLYYMSGCDSIYVKSLMEDLKNKGRFEVKPEILSRIREIFKSYSVSEDEIRSEIKYVYDEYGYVLDPHSAVGYRVSRLKGEGKIITLSTASPYKFSKDVLYSLGEDIDDEFMAMDRLSTLSKVDINPNLKELKDLQVRFKDVINKEDIIDKVKDILND